MTSAPIISKVWNYCTTLRDDGVGVRFIRELEHGKPSCHMGKALQVMAMLGLDVFIEGCSAS